MSDTENVNAGPTQEEIKAYEDSIQINRALKDSAFVSSLGLCNGTQPEEIERRARVALGL